MAPAAVWLTLTALVLIGGGIFWWSRRQRKSPAERERLRRLDVNARGRLTDGAVIDAPYSSEPAAGRDLLFYSYCVAGVEYSAAQDLSTLSERLSESVWRPGTFVTVKYDPRRPSNSIIICELWSGLPARKADSADSLRDTAHPGLAGAA